MTASTFETLEDLQSIVVGKICESVSLEYKNSRTLIQSDIASICKGVTALANSAGGYFLIGIESKKQIPIGLDGGVPGSSRRDWLFQIINTHTHPPVEDLEIKEISDAEGTYYALRVERSSAAPHQSDDHKYYKRRGSHSEPMEHYEIEDVRNRPKKALAPLRVEIFAERQLAHLHFKNDHEIESLKSITCRITANFNLERDGISTLRSRGIRQLRPQMELFFLLDSFYTILSEAPEAEVTVEATYQFRGTAMHHTASFCLSDFSNSSIVQPLIVEKLENINKTIGCISSEIKNLGSDIKKLSRISDATGLRLSQRTLARLQKSSVLFDPMEFDWDGYKVILGISCDEALELYGIFHAMNHPELRRENFERLPVELKDKFKAHFDVKFE